MLDGIEPALFMLLDIISVRLLSFFIHSEELLSSGVDVQRKYLYVGLWIEDLVCWVFKLCFNVKFNRFFDVLIRR